MFYYYNWNNVIDLNETRAVKIVIKVLITVYNVFWWVNHVKLSSSLFATDKHWKWDVRSYLPFSDRALSRKSAFPPPYYLDYWILMFNDMKTQREKKRKYNEGYLKFLTSPSSLHAICNNSKNYCRTWNWSNLKRLNKLFFFSQTFFWQCQCDILNSFDTFWWPQAEQKSLKKKAFLLLLQLVLTLEVWNVDPRIICQQTSHLE